MKYFFLLFILFLVPSCRTVTPLPHPAAISTSLREKCFPAVSQSAFRAVHVIHATIRGQSSSFIGVTIADVSTDRIRATLLNIEGLVLMDAVDNKGKITLYQSMQPFNSVRFADGLFDDIRFMFFPPHGDLIDARVKADGTVACTWIDHGHVFEKNAAVSGETMIKEYDSDHKIIRQVRLSPPIIKGFYKDISMDHYYGSGGYSLSLELLEGEHLKHVDGLFAP